MDYGNEILLCAGTLPTAWGSPDAFHHLYSLQLQNLSLTGTLPVSWGGNGSFPSLAELSFLNLTDNKLSGPLPQSWASNRSWPRLLSLSLGSSKPGVCGLSGTLPAEWGAPGSLPWLEWFMVENCDLTGDTSNKYDYVLTYAVSLGQVQLALERHRKISMRKTRSQMKCFYT